jgi:hypothetical protein
MKFVGSLPSAPAQPQFGVLTPQLELFLDLDRGKINARRQAVPSLELMIRAGLK